MTLLIIASVFMVWVAGIYWCNFAPQTRTSEYRKRWRRDRGLE